MLQLLPLRKNRKYEFFEIILTHGLEFVIIKIHKAGYFILNRNIFFGGGI